MRKDIPREFYAENISGEYGKHRLDKDSKISDENKKEVHAFIASVKAHNNIKDKRVAKLYSSFKTLLNIAGRDFSLRDTNEKGLEKLVIEIDEAAISEWTKVDLKKVLKRYYTLKNKGETPKKIRWLKTGNPKPKHKTAEELISKVERNMLVDACKNERDRAFVMLLYEGGLRAGEMSALKINSISFDDDGMWVDIPDVPGLTKTGGRRILTIESEPYMKNWINVHPGKNDPNNPLWVKVEQYVKEIKPMTYDNMRMMMARKVETAGLTQDKFNLHNFRHSSATEKAAYGWNKAQMDFYFGWEPSSNTASTYIHLQEKDMVSAVRKLHGLPVAEEAKRKEKITCQRCRKINDADARFCSQCQVPLNLKVALEQEEKRKSRDDLLGEVLEDPKIRELIVEKLLEKRSKKELLEILG